jgi:uncharacterized protein YutE (UPF0331/DUF86 family)
MPNELLDAKLNQLLHVLSETDEWLEVPPDAFGKDTKLVRACQRNLQLLVEYAADINGILILERGTQPPRSYRESFTEVFGMPIAAALPAADREALLTSVDWRNELIHEYEPSENNDAFYAKLKDFTRAYREYARVIHAGLGPTTRER